MSLKPKPTKKKKPKPKMKKKVNPSKNPLKNFKHFEDNYTPQMKKDYFKSIQKFIEKSRREGYILPEWELSY